MAYRLPRILSQEIEDLGKQIDRFKSGEISDTELKARRVPFGVYEQRVKGLYMARIRCAAGIITPAQLVTIGELAARYGSGRLHVTTRQEIQMHDLSLENLIPVIRGLLPAGLSTRGGGGNTVRNITASWDSGIASGESFDVTPHAVELTSRLIELPGSWLLPRKFKIAFSNSAADSAYATVNDVGFAAEKRGEYRGFRVFVAGGMGRSPQPGQLLHDFIQEEEVFEVAEAVKRVFSKHGNRRNRHSARLRFLWNSLGRERFVSLYEEERKKMASENPLPFAVKQFFREPLSTANISVARAGSPEFLLWQDRYSGSQRQTGYSWARIPLALGDIQAQTAIELAHSVKDFGDDVIRFTHDQNISVRNIPHVRLMQIFEIAQKISPLWNVVPVLSNAVACAGASTCQLGICLSRGALSASIEELEKSNIDLDSIKNFRIHFSGCFNSCGQHGISHIGFFGKAGRKNGHAYPAYSVVAGAKMDAVGGSTLAQTVGEVPARKVPQFLVHYLTHYSERSATFSSYHDYLDAEGLDKIRSLCEVYREVPGIGEDESFYYDWGAKVPFSLEGRGTGECAAGLFDLIDIDIERMRGRRRELSEATGKDTREAVLHDMIVHAARALLITKGIEAASDAEVFDQFSRHFFEPGLVSENFRELINAAAEQTIGLAEHESDAVAFCESIESLYALLDDTLQFHVSAPVTPQPPEQNAITVHLEKDFRGVACPLNFVKTKMALSQITSGQLLRVLLDDGEPIDNVPRSVESEGHRIIGKTKTGSHWSVIIEKVG